MDKGLVESIRPYVLNFVVGILWVVALAAMFLHRQHIVTLADTAEQIARRSEHVHAPDFAVGFLLVISGVIVPYSIAMALRPINIVLMNALLRLQQSKFRRAGREHLLALRQIAVGKISRSPVIQRHIGTDTKLDFVTMKADGVAANLRAIRQAIEFRAALVMPVSILFGAVVARTLNPHLYAVAALGAAVIVGVLVYTTGVWVANNDLERYKESLDVAVVVSSLATSDSVASVVDER